MITNKNYNISKENPVKRSTCTILFYYRGRLILHSALYNKKNVEEEIIDCPGLAIR